MKKTIKQRFFLSLCLLMLFSLFGGGNLAWAEAITDYNNIVSGKKYYIRATTGGTDYYLKVDGSATGTGKAGTAVTSEAEATVFVFEGSSTNWTIKFDGTENYLSLASSKANGKVNIVSSASTFTLSNQSAKNLIRISLGSYSIQKNSSATNFGSYSNSQTDVWLEPAAPLPTYNVSWMVNGESYTAGTPSTSVKKGESVTALPTEPAAIGSKEFVGWTNAPIAAAQPTAPTVLFTTPEDAPAVTGEVTYYAVFATQSDALTEVLSQTLAYDTWTYGGTTTNKGSYRLFHTGGYVQSKSFDLSTLSKVVVYGGTFGGDDYNTLEIGDGTNIWKTVTVFGKEATGVNTFTEGTPLSGEGVLKITSKSGTASDKGVRISKVLIYTLAHSYTDYVTTISSSPVTVTFNAGANGTCETPSLTETAAGAGVTLPVCVAKEGYKFVGWSTSETPTSADAGQAGETYYPGVDCTLYAYYKQLSTITKVVNGKSTTEQVENGAEIPFTNPDAASIPTGYVFMGWTATAVDGTQNEAPTLVSSPVTASMDATYYAVFAVSKSTGDVVWEEITTVPEPGTYAILSDSYFMKAKITSNRFENGAATPKFSATLPAKLNTAPASDCIWEITKLDDGYYRIANGGQYAGSTTNTEKAQGALLDDASKDLAKWTIEYNGSEFSIINYGRSGVTRKYLRNNDSNGWACYVSDTGEAPRLFKKKNATVLTDYCTTIPDVELAVGATGYATLYYSNYDLVVPANTEAYTFRSSNGALMKSKTYAADAVIPAGEAVVVHTLNGLSSTLNFKKGIATAACDPSSQLAGTDKETEITSDENYYFYGLSLNSNGDLNSVGFYWMNDTGAAFTNGAHKAYLKILQSEFADTQSVRGFAFKGTATGVESVESSNNAPQAIYDLTGRRVSKAEKGIYIINGKKVIK